MNRQGKRLSFLFANTALLAVERVAHLAGGLVGGLESVIDEGSEESGMPENVRGGAGVRFLAEQLKGVDLGAGIRLDQAVLQRLGQMAIWATLPQRF